MKSRRAFTLVELVVVILIIGILASVAALKLIDTSDAAEDSSLRQTLKTIRNAIELYRADNGAWPGASTGNQNRFKQDLAPYLQGSSFPAGPLGPAKGDDRIRMRNDGTPLNGGATPNRAWKYDYTTGEFIFNYNAPTASDPSVNYDDL